MSEQNDVSLEEIEALAKQLNQEMATPPAEKQQPTKGTMATPQIAVSNEHLQHLLANRMANQHLPPQANLAPQMMMPVQQYQTNTVLELVKENYFEPMLVFFLYVLFSLPESTGVLKNVLFWLGDSSDSYLSIFTRAVLVGVVFLAFKVLF